MSGINIMKIFVFVSVVIFNCLVLNTSSFADDSSVNKTEIISALLNRLNSFDILEARYLVDMPVKTGRKCEAYFMINRKRKYVLCEAAIEKNFLCNVYEFKESPTMCSINSVDKSWFKVNSLDIKKDVHSILLGLFDATRDGMFEMQRKDIQRILTETEKCVYPNIVLGVDEELNNVLCRYEQQRVEDRVTASWILALSEAESISIEKGSKTITYTCNNGKETFSIDRVTGLLKEYVFVTPKHPGKRVKISLIKANMNGPDEPYTSKIPEFDKFTIDEKAKKKVERGLFVGSLCYALNVISEKLNEVRWVEYLESNDDVILERLSNFIHTDTVVTKIFEDAYKNVNYSQEKMRRFFQQFIKNKIKTEIKYKDKVDLFIKYIRRKQNLFRLDQAVLKHVVRKLYVFIHAEVMPTVQDGNKRNIIYFFGLLIPALAESVEELTFDEMVSRMQKELLKDSPDSDE